MIKVTLDCVFYLLISDTIVRKIALKYYSFNGFIISRF